MKQASKRLRATGVLRLLVDNTVLAHSVTHETAWIDTGKAQWGEIEVDTGYMARPPVHSDQDDRDAAQSVRYLPGIADLARKGLIVLAASDELKDEQFSHPPGRFSGYGYYDFSLLSGVPLETIHDADYTVVFSSAPGFPDEKEQRRKRLDAKQDPLFTQLAKALGPSNSQDAWHITVAERNDCYCFLTMDFRLVRNVMAQSKNPAIQSLRTKVLTPEEFGRRFLIVPIPPRLYSYHEASFPVEHGANWPDSIRQKKRKG